MSGQTIQSRDISVADVFKDFYAVPDYQREYVWEAEEVEQLLTDIRAEMGSGSHAGAPEYFIGSIVICPGKGGVLDLIDGQQRMTTLYLTLCAIRDHLQEIGDRPPGRWSKQQPESVRRQGRTPCGVALACVQNRSFHTTPLIPEQRRGVESPGGDNVIAGICRS